MTNNLLLVFLLFHIFADFYAQNEGIARKKDSKIFYNIMHSFTYLVVSIIFITPIFSMELLKVVLILSGTHFVIDFLKMLINKCCARYSDNKISKLLMKGFDKGVVFVVDQALHLISILLIYSFFKDIQDKIIVANWVLFAFSNFDISMSVLLRGALLFLLVAKPINLIFKKLFIKPAEELELEDMVIPKEELELKDENKRMGARIGILERFLILIFLLLHQYAAIALVLTAKSIARYNKIIEDKKFGEYYLSGTLFSVLAVIVSYLLIW